MNIVIFTDTFLPKIDGIAISVDRFTRLLTRRGHNFVICAPEYGPDDPEGANENIEIVRFRNAPLPSYPEIKLALPSHKRIDKAMTHWKADLIHIQSPGPLGNYGVLASRMYGVPIIGTYHTLISEQDTYISLYRLIKIDMLLNFFKSNKKVRKNLDKIERKEKKGIRKQIIQRFCNTVYETNKLIISPSHLIKDELLEEGIRTPIEVISNGMDLEQFSGKVKAAPSRPPKLLHVGRISYEKNCDVVIKAFARMHEDMPDATLDIVGDGPALTSLKIQARQLELHDHINFHGYVPHNDLPKLYPEYDVFVTASTMETQGLVVLEAMACGLPCVGVSAFALPELIQNDRNGFIVDPYDHIALAERTKELLEDPQLYGRFSAQSLEISKEHDIHACADRMETVYRMVVEGEI